MKREKSLISAYIQFPCKATTIPNGKGKVPNSLNSPIYIEYDQYLNLIARYLPDPLHQNADFIDFLNQDNNLLDQFADQFVMTLPNPRSEYYL